MRAGRAASSRRGREAALLFFWPELERQIRIEGEIAKVRCRRVGRVFREPAARRAPRRVGVAAERADRGPRRSGGMFAAAEARLRERGRRHSATAALGRLSPRALDARILAGPSLVGCTTAYAIAAIRTVPTRWIIERFAP